MHAPESFVRLARLFYQGSFDEHSSQERWIEATVAFLNESDKQEVKLFLDTALSCSEMEMEQIWRDSSPGYLFEGSGATRAFFAMIRREVSADK